MGQMRAVRRWAVVGYAGAAYAAFLVVALWGVAFLADVGPAHTVDQGPAGPGWVAVLVDVALLLAFGVQHSVMARAGFKRRVARLVPQRVERATYVLATALLLGLLFGLWRALPAVVWRVDAPPWRAAVWTVYATGWAVAVAATFMVDHLDFLGVRQAVAHARARAYRAPAFTGRWLYAWVRHPMMLGLLVAFWATPRMTAGHLLFAAGATAYVAVGVHLEERDLRRQFGQVYDEYAAHVPAVVPGLRRRAAPDPAGRLDRSAISRWGGPSWTGRSSGDQGPVNGEHLPQHRTPGTTARLSRAAVGESTLNIGQSQTDALSVSCKQSTNPRSWAGSSVPTC